MKQCVGIDFTVFKFFINLILIVNNLLLIDLLDEMLFLLNNFLRMLIGPVFYLTGAFNVTFIFIYEYPNISLAIDHLNRIREFR